MRRLSALAGFAPLLYAICVHAAVVTGFAGLRFAALVVLILNAFGPWLVRRRPGAWIAASGLIAATWPVMNTVGAGAFLYAAPVLICLALAWFFGRTLCAGRTPLITKLADTIRGPLPAPVRRYTRGVTVFWFAIMLTMALVDLSLALFASPEIWSLFANVVNYLIIAALFVLEWCVRQWAIGEYEHLGWRGYLKALRHIDYHRVLHG